MTDADIIKDAKSSWKQYFKNPFNEYANCFWQKLRKSVC